MTIRKCFKVNASDITLIQFIIEGYEGMAVVSTVDPKAAFIQVLIMPDFEYDAVQLLESMKKQFHMEEVKSDHMQVLLC